MNRIAKCVLVLGVLLAAPPSFAQTPQPVETVPAADYPGPQCTKPDLKSVKPPELKDRGNVFDAAELAAYNAKVRAYNSMIKTVNQASKDYSACMHAYIDKADRDAQKIQDQANAAIKAINARMRAAAAALNELSASEDGTIAALQKSK